MARERIDGRGPFETPHPPGFYRWVKRANKRFYGLFEEGGEEGGKKKRPVRTKGLTKGARQAPSQVARFQRRMARFDELQVAQKPSLLTGKAAEAKERCDDEEVLSTTQLVEEILENWEIKE